MFGKNMRKGSQSIGVESWYGNIICLHGMNSLEPLANSFPSRKAVMQTTDSLKQMSTSAPAMPARKRVLYRPRKQIEEQLYVCQALMEHR